MSDNKIRVAYHEGDTRAGAKGFKFLSIASSYRLVASIILLSTSDVFLANV